MTENDTIKALGCGKSIECKDCPYRDVEMCLDKVCEDALSIINRQKAEISKLKGQVARLKQYDEERDIRLHARLSATAKAEGIKEFAERLKALKIKPEFPWDDFFVTEDAIDNLVKEMTGEKT